MSGDIVQRLRDHLHMTPTGEIRLSTGLAELFGVGCVRCEAADEIERLRDVLDIKECKVETLSNQIEQLQAELDDDDNLRSQMTIILHRVAVALHGEPLENGLWSWHDLPERAAAERALADQMAGALRAVKHDRPTAHTDKVWSVVCDALDDYGKARRDLSKDDNFITHVVSW